MVHTPLINSLIDRKPLLGNALIERDKLIKSAKRDEALLKLKDGVLTIKQPSEAAKLITGTGLSILVRTVAIV